MMGELYLVYFFFFNDYCVKGKGGDLKIKKEKFDEVLFWGGNILMKVNSVWCLFV